MGQLIFLILLSCLRDMNGRQFHHFRSQLKLMHNTTFLQHSNVKKTWNTVYLAFAGKMGQYNIVKTVKQRCTVVNAPITKPHRTDCLIVCTKLKPVNQHNSSNQPQQLHSLLHKLCLVLPIMHSSAHWKVTFTQIHSNTNFDYFWKMTYSILCK